MKKLSKLNLDELAEQMDQMSKQETEATRGGDYYYTPNGTFLGKEGEGNTVRVIDINFGRIVMALNGN